MAGATAILLLLVGFGFKVAAVPFHQWAPDAYEGAPAPVTAWIATGSKLASFVAFMKVFLHALLPWASPSTSIMGPGWIGIIAIISAVTMTYGNFAALAQKNLKRMLAYSSIAHAGYILVGVAAVSISMKGPSAAGSVLFYLIVYSFANVGAFAVAAWLARDLDSDNIDDLNGLGYQEPLLATCIVLLMLSLIGIPPLAGFFGKLYVFMEALNQTEESQKVHVDLAGGTRPHELGRVGVLLRPSSQGDVSARGGNQKAGRARPGDLDPDRIGNGCRCGLWPDASVVDEHDAGRGRSDVDEPGRHPRRTPPRRKPGRPTATGVYPVHRRRACGERPFAQGEATCRKGAMRRAPKARVPSPRARAPPPRAREPRQRPNPACPPRPRRRHPRRPARISMGKRIDARLRSPDRHEQRNKNRPRTDTRRHGHGHHQHVSEVP